MGDLGDDVPLPARNRGPIRQTLTEEASPHSRISGKGRSEVRVTRGRTVLAAAIGGLLGAIALCFAACGGPSSPSVASNGSTTTTTAPSSTSRNVQFARFGACMRSHGEPQFQNPIANGNTVTMKITPSLGIGSPRYARAAADCRQYLPLGSVMPGSQGVTQADQVDYLRAVACMRSQGYPSIPDPTFTARNVHIAVPANIDENAPQFQKALSICRKLIPAGLPYSG